MERGGNIGIALHGLHLSGPERLQCFHQAWRCWIGNINQIHPKSRKNHRELRRRIHTDPGGQAGKFQLADEDWLGRLGHIDNGEPPGTGGDISQLTLSVPIIAHNHVAGLASKLDLSDDTGDGGLPAARIQPCNDRVKITDSVAIGIRLVRIGAKPELGVVG